MVCGAPASGGYRAYREAAIGPTGRRLAGRPGLLGYSATGWAAAPGRETGVSCTMSSSILVRVTCDAICVSVRIDADSGEPVLTMDDPDDCRGGLLPGTIDLVRSDFGSLTETADYIDLGVVEPIGCDVADEKHGFCSGRLESGQVELFLARNVGEENYGSSSAGLPRVATSGDCP